MSEEEPVDGIPKSKPPRILLNKIVLKRLIKSRGKRMSPDYVVYLNRKLESIVLSHIHMLGSRGTLKAKDFVYFDAVRKEGR